MNEFFAIPEGHALTLTIDPHRQSAWSLTRGQRSYLHLLPHQKGTPRRRYHCGAVVAEASRKGASLPKQLVILAASKTQDFHRFLLWSVPALTTFSYPYTRSESAYTLVAAPC